MPLPSDAAHSAHNLRDFPRANLEPYGVEAIHPDEFVLDLLDLAPGAVLRVLQEQAAALKRPDVGSRGEGCTRSPVLVSSGPMQNSQVPSDDLPQDPLPVDTSIVGFGFSVIPLLRELEAR